MSSIRTYGKNILFNWGGFAANVVVTLYVSRLVLNALGEDRASVWALIVGLVGTMGLVDFGLRPAFFRQVNALIGRGERHRINEFASTVLTCFIGALVPLVVVSAICGAYFGDIFPDVAPEFRAEAVPTFIVVALFLGVSMMTAILSSILDCHERFDLRNMMSTVYQVARGVGAAWALHGGPSMTLLALSQLGAVIMLVIGSWFMVKRVVPDFTFSPRLMRKAALKELLAQGIPLFFHGASLRIIFYVDSFLIAWLVDYRLVVHYSYATQIVNQGGTLISLAGRVFVPKIHRMASAGDLAGLRYFVPHTTRALMGPVILILVGSMVFGPEFLGLFYGERTAQIGALVLPLVAIAFLGPMSTIAPRAVLVGAGRSHLVAIYSLIEAAVNVASSVIFVTVFDLGLAGIALGTLVSMILCSGVLMLRRALEHFGLGVGPFVRATVIYWVPAALLFFGASEAVKAIVPGGTWLGFMTQTLVATLLSVPILGLLLFPADVRRRSLDALLRRGRKGATVESRPPGES